MYHRGHPAQLTIVRHGESEMNKLFEVMSRDPEYEKFRQCYNANATSREAKKLARRLVKKFGCKMVDYSLSLTELGARQAFETGQKLRNIIQLPQVVIVSPYTRTMQTFENIQKGWPELKKVHSWNLITENALREQEFGQVYLYTDFDFLFALNEDEGKLYNADKYSPYFYRFPGGESLADLTARVDNWYSKILTQYAGKRILVISHNRAIYAIRSILESWDFRSFMDEHDAHIIDNCGVTIYNKEISSSLTELNPMQAFKAGGKMELAQFNLNLWKN